MCEGERELVVLAEFLCEAHTLVRPAACKICAISPLAATAAAASALNFPFAELYCWWVAVQFFQSGADTKGSLLFRGHN